MTVVGSKKRGRSTVEALHEKLKKVSKRPKGVCELQAQYDKRMDQITKVSEALKKAKSHEKELKQKKQKKLAEGLKKAKLHAKESKLKKQKKDAEKKKKKNEEKKEKAVESQLKRQELATADKVASKKAHKQMMNAQKKRKAKVLKAKARGDKIEKGKTPIKVITEKLMDVLKKPKGEGSIEKERRLAKMEKLKKQLKKLKTQKKEENKRKQAKQAEKAKRRKAHGRRNDSDSESESE